MSYRLRIIAAVLGGLSISVWQLTIGLREGDGARLVALGIGVALGVLVPAFVLHVRALPRLEIKKRLGATSGVLFEGRIDANGLAELGQGDVTGVTDVIIAVDDIGLHIHPAVPSGGEILLRYPEITDIAVSGDDDPTNAAGMVALAVNRGSPDLSITLYAPFKWGAFPATPTATQSFVDTVRSHAAI